jgi:hypothetical protein
MQIVKKLTLQSLLLSCFLVLFSNSVFAISSGESVNASIAVPGDEDSYSFSASSGDGVHMSAGGTLRMHLTLIAPDGAEVTHSGSSGRLSSTLPQTGTYTVVARGYYGENSSSVNTGSYTFHFVKAPGGSEYGEPASGVTHSDTITEGDLDSFSVTALAGDSIQVSAGGELLLHLVVYSPSGSLVTHSGSNGRVTATASQAGTYTVVVQSYYSSFSSVKHTGSYDFHYVRGSGGSEYGEIISGSSYSDGITIGDIDSYSFSGTAGESIQLVVDGDLLLQMRLFAPDGSQVTHSGSNEQISINSLPQSGTYTVTVYSYYNPFSSGLNTGTYTTNLTLQGQIISYAALGDSYSSGEGVFPFLGQYGVDWGPFQGCNRSATAYSRAIKLPGNTEPLSQSADALFNFYACTGAVTENLQATGEGQYDEPPQTANGQVDATRELITLTIGGNDAQFVRILAYCLAHNHCNDLKPFDPYFDIELGDLFPLWLAVVKQRLVNTYTEIKNKAPNATIVVSGYPLLVSGNECIGTQIPGYPDANLSADEQAWMRQANTQLNTVISEAAAQVGVHFVPVADHFEQHGVCGDQEDWIFGTVHFWPQGFFHPTSRGQKEYAKLINAYLGSINHGWSQGYFPSGLPRNPAPIATTSNINGFALMAQSFNQLPSFGELKVQLENLHSACDGATNTIIPGQAVTLSGSGFAAQESVTFTLLANGQSYNLGAALSDQNGDISISITIPGIVSSGGSAIMEAFAAGANLQGNKLIAPVKIRAELSIDSDGDGIPDSCDNCLNDSNVGQSDLDFDGLGDVCDLCPQESLNDEDNDGMCRSVDICPIDAGNDADGDGFCESDDNCPLLANINQTDTDFDLLGNTCDSDDDNDGLLDNVETGTGVYVSELDTGTDPLNNDSDADGIDDATEIAIGSNPNGDGSLIDYGRDEDVPLPLWAYLVMAAGLGWIGQKRRV